MALITCEECGKEISSLAEVCPHCGCPTELGRIKIASASAKIELEDKRREAERIQADRQRQIDSKKSQAEIYWTTWRILNIISNICGVPILCTLLYTIYCFCGINNGTISWGTYYYFNLHGDEMWIWSFIIGAVGMAIEIVGRIYRRKARRLRKDADNINISSSPSLGNARGGKRRRCPNCGAKCESSDLFCIKCGTELNKEATGG